MAWICFSMPDGSSGADGAISPFDGRLKVLEWPELHVSDINLAIRSKEDPSSKSRNHPGRDFLEAKAYQHSEQRKLRAFAPAND